MKLDDLRLALRQWGIATANRYCMTRSDRTEHMLDKAREMAPGTKENALRALVGRDGRDRRRLMAAGTGVDSMRLLPWWAADPIPASNDAQRPHDRAEIAFDQGIPDELMWVERAVAQLTRQYPLRGLVVRTEYTISTSQESKARMVREEYGGSLTLRQYRLELHRSWDWLAGRMAA
jgi:hypothetical protein